MPIHADINEAEIVRRLATIQPNLFEDMDVHNPYPLEFLSKDPIPAAVLMPLLKRNGVWHLLFIRRNAEMAEHSGQVAFPGGRSEPDDPDLPFTALREAKEEIGLHPEDVRLLGNLPQFRTITNYLVTPFIGIVPWPYKYFAAKEEVSRIFTIPLKWLAEKTNHTIETRKLPPPYDPIPVIYYKPYRGEVLWGASARFVAVLLDLLTSE